MQAQIPVSKKKGMESRKWRHAEWRGCECEEEKAERKEVKVEENNRGILRDREATQKKKGNEAFGRNKSSDINIREYSIVHQNVLCHFG